MGPWQTKLVTVGIEASALLQALVQAGGWTQPDQLAQL